MQSLVRSCRILASRPVVDSVSSLAQCLGRRIRGPTLSVNDAFDDWGWAVITAMVHGPLDAKESVQGFGV